MQIILLKLSKRKLCLFALKTFLYIEKLLSTSTDVIGANLNAFISETVYSCTVEFCPDRQLEISFKVLKPRFFFQNI